MDDMQLAEIEQRLSEFDCFFIHDEIKQDISTLIAEVRRLQAENELLKALREQDYGGRA